MAGGRLGGDRRDRETCLRVSPTASHTPNTPSFPLLRLLLSALCCNHGDQRCQKSGSLPDKTCWSHTRMDARCAQNNNKKREKEKKKKEIRDNVSSFLDGLCEELLSLGDMHCTSVQMQRTLVYKMPIKLCACHNRRFKKKLKTCFHLGSTIRHYTDHKVQIAELSRVLCH